MKYLVLVFVGLAVAAGLFLLGPRALVVAPQNPDASDQTASLAPPPSAPPIAPTSSIVTEAPGVSVNFSTTAPLQGDTVRVDISENAESPSVFFDDKSVPVFRFQNELHALLPIGAHESVGKHIARVDIKGELEVSKTITVKLGGFPVVDLGIPEKLNTTPTQLVADLSKENADINSLVALITPNIFFAKNFGLPLADNSRIIAQFGEIRKTGDQTISHLGVDFEAPEGSAVVAMNDGVVEEADNTALYGNMVIVNHGEGIYSMYLHLKTIKTQKGMHVAKGGIVGTVGETGYATGPHLHLSLKVNGVSVDPLKFVDVLR